MILSDPLAFWFYFWSYALLGVALIFILLQRRLGHFNLLAPSSFMALTCALQFGILNRPAVLFGELLSPNLIGNDPLLLRTMALALFSLAAFGITYLISYRAASRRLAKHPIPETAASFAPRLFPLMGCYLIGIFARLILIRMGAYSYLADPSQPEGGVVLVMFLGRLERFCVYTLLVLCILRFLHPGKRLFLWLLLFVFFAELAVNFMGGTKGLTLINFLYVGFVWWSIRGRMPSPLLAVAVLITWVFVTPWNLAYRAQINSGRVDTTNLGSVSQALGKSFEAAFTSTTESDPIGYFLENVQARLPLLQEAALVSDYADQTGFTYGKKYWLLLPAAIIPRFLWPDKPQFRTGTWVTREIFGQELEEGTSSTSISALGDFYMDFGLFGPILGFAVWGWLVGWLESFFKRSTWGILLGGAFYLALIRIPNDEAYWLLAGLAQEFFVVSCFAVFIGLVPAAFFLRRRPNRSSAPGLVA